MRTNFDRRSVQATLCERIIALPLRLRRVRYGFILSSPTQNPQQEANEYKYGKSYANTDSSLRTRCEADIIARRGLEHAGRVEELRRVA